MGSGEAKPGGSAVQRILVQAASLVAVVLSLYHLGTSVFGIPSAMQHRAIFLCLAEVVAFLSLPLSPKSKAKIPALDILLAVLAVLSLSHIVVEYVNIAYRAGEPNRADIIYGLITMALVIELARRKIGFQIVVLPLIFVAYLWGGHLIPGVLGHPRLSTARIVNTIYLGTDGIMGAPLGAAATYVVVFVILGNFLEKTGVGEYFIKLAYSLVGRSSSGPAQTSVMASGLFGMISGSPPANVVTTGVFTIPLMKSSGYKPESAAAVEAIASTGGQIMPPIMGATAFIIAETLGISYLKLIGAAVLPAILYYIGCSVSVHLEAKKHGVRPDFSKVPSVTVTLREGWWYLLPILLLVYLLVVARLSVFRAAVWSLASALAIALTNKKDKLTFKGIWEALSSSGKGVLTVAAATASAGIIVGAVTVTGLGLKMSMFISNLAGQNILAALILVWLVAVILGMGLPTSAAYITTAALLVPALVKLGMAPVVAHMFVFYAAIVSNLTPPVCVASYTAAGIAQCDPWKTALAGFSMGFPGPFLVPFIFAYRPALMFTGSTSTLPVDVLTAILTVTSVACSFRGYCLTEIKAWQRVLFAVACVLFIPPVAVLNLVGLAIVVALLLTQLPDLRKSRGPACQVQS
ncbi:MAG: TRAP transporter permease [Ignavibacteriales bacterium]